MIDGARGSNLFGRPRGRSTVGAQAAAGAVRLHRRLGFWACLAIMLGNIVGVGIFLTPSEVAAASPNVATYMALWVLGGLMAATGAHVYAELGMLFPAAGGDYVFLDKAYGRPIARAWGWLAVFGSFPGSLAALAVGIVGTLAQTSMGAFLSEPIVTTSIFMLTAGDAIGVSCILLASGVNWMGLSWTSFVQILLSLFPVTLFFGVAVATIPGWHMMPDDIVHRSGPRWDTTGIAAACCAVFFTYSGWNVLTYVGGEIRTPTQTIPRVIIAGVVVTTAIYMVLNLAFLTVSPLGTLGDQTNAGVALANAKLGPLGAQAFSILLAMALLAGINATMMAGSRVAYAMAEDGLLWRRIRRLDPRSRTPATAIALQGALASLLVLTGSFSFLVTWTGSLMILLSCVTISTIFVFRWRRGMRPPIALAGYPWTALVFLACGLGVWLLGLAQVWKLFLASLLLFGVLSVVPMKQARASSASGSDVRGTRGTELD